MIKKPDSISYYLKKNYKVLIVVAISGILYDIGFLFIPIYEGKFAEALLKIHKEDAPYSLMLTTVLTYLFIVLVVQGNRAIKRLTVRILGNNINKEMRLIVFSGLLTSKSDELLKAGAGAGITKAISDVDNVSEGIRKVTTEIFDTGIYLGSYAILLLIYDWRISLIFLIFPPLSYFISDIMKKKINICVTEKRALKATINERSIERIHNATTLRINSAEENAEKRFEALLSEYETKSRKAESLISALPPLYQIICLLGLIFVLYFGAKNVLGSGWCVWSIATFTAYISAATRLANKSSKASKLFNSIEKAKVSWKGIKPLLKDVEFPEAIKDSNGSIDVENMSFSYKNSKPLFENISFSAHKGEIIGITGSVACGKTTLSRLFLGELDYSGSIKINEHEVKDLKESEINSYITYLGHNLELFSLTAEENILLGKDGDADEFLKLSALDKEINKTDLIGEGGQILSGGQKERIALSRVFAHIKSIVILDDPFAALDKSTELEVFNNLREKCKDSVLIIFSHRLDIFPMMDKVIVIEDGKIEEGRHEELIAESKYYSDLYSLAGGKA